MGNLGSTTALAIEFFTKCELKAYIGKTKINSAKSLPPVVIEPWNLRLLDILWSTLMAS